MMLTPALRLLFQGYAGDDDDQRVAIVKYELMSARLCTFQRTAMPEAVEAFVGVVFYFTLPDFATPT